MIERGEHARFALETRQALGIRGELCWKHLQGDIPPKPGVVSAIYLAHSAPTDERNDAIAAQLTTREVSRVDTNKLSGGGTTNEILGRQHGFLLVDGRFTTIDVPVPGARLTNAFGINARGDIVGSWVDSGGMQRGFLLPAYGSFTVIDGPSAIRTLARGINSAGDVVGYYDTADERHGFLLSRDGSFSTIDLPATQGPPPNGTFPQWISARGDIVGSFFDGSVHGFLMSAEGLTQLDVPFPGAVNTNAPGLNDAGDIVGFYTVGGRQVAFRRDRHGNYQSLDAPTTPLPSSTLAIGINASGDIVGQYTHLGVTRGFVIYRARTQ
jgi:uncharacterized membrane protein